MRTGLLYRLKEKKRDNDSMDYIIPVISVLVFRKNFVYAVASG